MVIVLSSDVIHILPREPSKLVGSRAPRRTGASRCPYAFKPDRGKPLSLRVQAGQGQAAVPTRSNRTGTSRCPYAFKPDRGKPLSLRVQAGQGQAAVPTCSNRTGTSRCPYAFKPDRGKPLSLRVSPDKGDFLFLRVFGLFLSVQIGITSGPALAE